MLLLLVLHILILTYVHFTTAVIHEYYCAGFTYMNIYSTPGIFSPLINAYVFRAGEKTKVIYERLGPPRSARTRT